MGRFLASAVVSLVLVGLLWAEPKPARDPYGQPGPDEVEVTKLEWKDSRRERDIPVLIYAPKGKGPFPVIVFSHGLGGSREGYAYLGKHWASHGYVCVHVQHRGSDDAVWKESKQPLADLKKAAADPSNAVNRPLDITFAIDELTRLQREDGPLKGRLDLDRIGVAGHSFGAYTTLAVAGQLYFPLGKEKSAGDSRVKAVIPMSSPIPAMPKERLAKSFEAVKIPCFHMTGTKDDSPIGDTKAGDRRQAFDLGTAKDQYLLIFEGGDHMIFSGRGRASESDAAFQAIIRSASLAFWDAYLRGDPRAKTWLREGGVKDRLGSSGTFEQR